MAPRYQERLWLGGSLIKAESYQCRSHIRQIAKKVICGEIEPKLEKQEKDLYMNPRRVR